MQSVNNFIGNGILWGMVLVAVCIQISKALNRSAPEITGAAKKAAVSQALNFIGKFIK